MTEMADEIRTLIADLYDDPEDFLTRPHQWFGGRSPVELMATEAGEFMLLKFLRGGDHMPPIEPDRDFRPYTAANTDHFIERVIARLERQIERLRSLKGTDPEIAAVIGKAQEVFGEQGLIWLVEHNQVLQATPLDLIAQGKIGRVLTLLGQIEYGVYV
ncbi:antitoxin Xre/MbcA/ParS toxin-binding domain-containing protein [Microvirga zambiensis]|uniref:antitoxin Xre/MbcA/ParS toxin-binding domain-containing protein n=1 Tax=Microvirga zambiensis TaxID=1402137 RepID=UPI00191F689A|nr:antitoxin Xre/MbcA/ParS toxin-binding domain-containing protein [Microvirga zambiensis]